MKTISFSLTGIAFLLLAFTCAAATTHYVDLSSTNSTPPFTDWSTAATNIQDAIDAAVDGDSVFVTNGVYQAGARVSSDGVTNRVMVTNAVTVRGVNGWQFTVIDGRRAGRCVYLADGAVLSGVAVTNGSVLGQFSGGVYCASSNAWLINCLIISNSSAYGGGIIYGSASNCIISFNRSSGPGGGVESCWLYNCILLNNYSGGRGGGASAGVISAMNNCIVAANTATSKGGGAFGYALINNCLIISNTCWPSGSGGGTSGCSLNNCTVVGNAGFLNGGTEDSVGAIFPAFTKNSIVYYNLAGNIGTLATNCCSIPMAAGAGNFTNAPLFANAANGDFHLLANSPCINAGNNSFVTTLADLDGNPRIVGGTVDIGAYEIQSPASVLSYAWAQQYGLPTDGSADFTDADGDGLNNWQEWIAGTIPTNVASVLKLNPPSNNVTGLAISWQSVSGKTYDLQRGGNLATQPAFLSVQSNITGKAGTTVYMDTSAKNGGPYFYRIGVR